MWNDTITTIYSVLSPFLLQENVGSPRTSISFRDVEEALQLVKWILTVGKPQLFSNKSKKNLNYVFSLNFRVKKEAKGTGSNAIRSNIFLIQKCPTCLQREDMENICGIVSVYSLGSFFFASLYSPKRRIRLIIS